MSIVFPRYSSEAPASPFQLLRENPEKNDIVYQLSPSCTSYILHHGSGKKLQFDFNRIDYLKSRLSEGHRFIFNRHLFVSIII
jgi:hypothetical protein